MRPASLSDRQRLAKIHALLRQVGVQLKILATLIDDYPYGLNGAGYQCFERTQTDYQRCTEQYKRLAQPPSEEEETETKDTKEIPQSLLRSAQQIHQQLDDYLAGQLSISIEALNDELLKDSLRSLQQSLWSMTAKPHGVGTPDQKIQEVDVGYADDKASSDRALEALKNRVHGLKQGLLKGISFKAFKNPRFYHSLEMKALDFLAAKRHQHRIVALRTRLNDT